MRVWVGLCGRLCWRDEGVYPAEELAIRCHTPLLTFPGYDSLRARTTHEQGAGGLMEIRHLVETAFGEARGRADNGKSRGEVNRNRSAEFVSRLATALHRECEGDEQVIALSKHNADHRERFGVNELLFDITVCRTDTVASGTSGGELSFVTKGLWAVESEMAKDKREALIDFNKLVLAGAENKLFVGPQVSDEGDYLRVLGAAARHCSGNLFVALIPHPGEWADAAHADVRVWQWTASAWESVN